MTRSIPATVTVPSPIMFVILCTELSKAFPKTSAKLSIRAFPPPFSEYSLAFSVAYFGTPGRKLAPAPW